MRLYSGNHNQLNREQYLCKFPLKFLEWFRSYGVQRFLWSSLGDLDLWLSDLLNVISMWTW